MYTEKDRNDSYTNVVFNGIATTKASSIVNTTLNTPVLKKEYYINSKRTM